jgi:hypothetical protein
LENARTEKESANDFGRVTSSIRMSSGVHRTTRRERFREVDVVLDGLLESCFVPADKLRVEDWATSDALAASEFAVRVLRRYPYAEIIASDCVLYLLKVARTSQELLILESDGSPLQYVRPPFVVSLCTDERWFYPINRMYRWIGQKRFNEFARVVGAMELKRLRTVDELTCQSWVIRKIQLIHPEAERLRQEDSRFRVELHDAFTASRERCHVLRVMNLYNPHVIGDSAVAAGARAVFDSLAEGGIAVIGRNDEAEGGACHATVFKRRDRKLVPVVRVGRGSEVEGVFTSDFPPAR